MKIAIVSRDVRRLKKHIKTISKYKKFLSKKPDVVIALGGDGTFLTAERYYPGIPKLLVRDQSICQKCDWDNLEEGIKRILNKRYYIEKFPKIEARVNGTRVEAVNDIVVRNIHPMHGIRFNILVNGKKLNKEFIGDGIVASTAWGSHGYFHSITRSHFEKGIGIAFNNSTKPHKPLIFPKGAKVTIKLNRGSAHVVGDNHPEIYLVPEGKRIVIRQCKEHARIVRLR